MSAPRLHPDDLEAIVEMTARRVVELLGAHAPVPACDGLLTAAQVAERFGVSRDWVYEHADGLGALRLGGGARPRLRFDPERVADALAPREGSEGSGARHAAPRLAGRRQAPPRTDDGCPLLPVMGDS